MIRRLFGFLAPLTTFVSVSVMALSLLLPATTAKAVTLIAGASVTEGDDEFTNGAFTLLDTDLYTPIGDLYTELQGSVIRANPGTQGPGISNLRMEWWVSGGSFLDAVDVTNNAGILDINNNLVEVLLSGILYELRIYGAVFGATPIGPAKWSYNLQASAVPIPPAALLFLTALGGVGWLGRRKAKARGLAPA